MPSFLTILCYFFFNTLKEVAEELPSATSKNLLNDDFLRFTQIINHQRL